MAPVNGFVVFSGVNLLKFEGVYPSISVTVVLFSGCASPLPVIFQPGHVTWSMKYCFAFLGSLVHGCHERIPIFNWVVCIHPLYNPLNPWWNDGNSVQRSRFWRRWSESNPETGSAKNKFQMKIHLMIFYLSQWRYNDYINGLDLYTFPNKDVTTI